MKHLLGRSVGWLILMAIFLSSPTPSPAQAYLVHRYSETNGLPSSTAFDVAQDPQGRIWLATRAGIAVHDGASWKSYTVSDGLPVLSFSHIRVDRRGKIWALSDLGQEGIFLVHHDGSRWHTIKNLKVHALEVGKMTSFQLLEPKQMDRPMAAVGTTKHGILLWKGGKWQSITKKNGLLSNFVSGIASLGEKYYVATARGLSTIDGDLAVDHRLNRLLDLPSVELKGIGVEYKDKFPGCRLDHSRVWLLGRGWIGYFPENSLNLTVYSVEISLTGGEAAEKLLPDYHCGLFMGNPNDLHYFHYKTRSWVSLDSKSGLIGEGANSMFIDFEKNIWIPCERGVSKISSRRFSNFQKVHGLLDDEVTAILEYEPGTFVLGHNTGITFYDGENFLKVPFPREILTTFPVCRVLDMSLDSKKNVWLAAAHAGLARVDPQRRLTWYDEADGLPDYVACLWIDERDNVWIGTGKGIFVRRETGQITGGTGNLPELNFRRIYGFSGKLRYLGSQETGLYANVGPDRQKPWKNYRVPGDRGANSIYALLKDSRGRLLIGTLRGLFVLEGETIRQFRIKNFHIDRPVYFILEDHRNRLWFGTDNGVVRWDGKEETKYSIGEGLIGQETNRAAALVDSRERIWIGTNRGVSVYDENFDDSGIFKPAPRVRLLYMEASDKKIPFKTPLRLSYEENTIVFHFRGTSFIDEASIRFKKRLEGFEEKWSEESYPHNQLVKYTNLPSGTYRFHLKAKNALGVWSDVVTSPPITILTPFYRQWWFYLSVLVLVGFVFFSISRFLSGKRHAALLEREVEERTDQLQAVEKRYRNLFEESKDVVFVSTPEGKLIDINPAGVMLFRYGSRAELLGVESTSHLYDNPRDRDKYREEIEGKGFVKDYELALKNKEGKRITGQVTATLVRDKENKIVAYRGIIRDITEKKRLEQQLVLAQKMEAIGTLAGGIAHDFNNILGAIVGFTELALDDLPPGTQVRDDIEQVMTAAERAKELVKQVLAVSRQSEQKRKPLMLGPIVKETLKLLRSSLPASIEIRPHIRAGSASVLADSTQIHQVVMNLCTNAAHAMREKGGILEVSLDEVYLDVEAVKRYNDVGTGAYLRLSVSDTGHGIPPPLMKRIFDPYFTTKKTGEGTGMGLAVVQGIVKSHGGDITVYSEPGKGSSFHVYLPQIEDEAEPETRLTEEIPGGSEGILLVDDEKTLVRVETQMLGRLGYKVVGKSSALEALKAFRREPDRFDLVITDLTMPHMNGTQLAKEIKRIKPGIPIILCSGFGMTVTDEQFRVLGIRDFIMKPIVKSELARMVRRVLDG